MNDSPYFHFKVEPEENDNSFSIVVFIPDGEFSFTSFADFIKEEVLKNPSVNRFEIVAPEFEFEHIQNELKNNPLFMSILERRPGLSAHLIGIDKKGKSGSVSHLFGMQEDPISIEKCLRVGLNKLGETNKGVRQIAPPNCIFQKPSGNSHTVFLRGGALIGSDAQCSFLALAILPYISTKEITKIYIDTMAIAPVVYKLILIQNRFEESKSWQPRTISFHSYSGFNSNSGIKPSDPEKAFVIISASSSGGLPEQIHKNWQVPEPNIITLLTFEDTATPDSPFTFIVPLEAPKEQTIANLTPVEITGEYFIPKYRKARRFLLKGFHAPKELKELMGKLYNKKIFSVRAQAGIYASIEELIKLKDFTDWYEKHIDNVAPISLSHIIYAEEESKGLAKTAKEIIDSKISKNVSIISANEIEKRKDIDGSVIVVSGIVRNGGILLDISRRLRNKVKDKNIKYIAGLHLPDSKEKSEKFKSSLTYSPSRRFSYSFECWMTLSIGRYGLGDWDSESKLIQELTNDHSDKFQDRWEKLKKPNIEEPFWPSPKEETLKIRKDFAFWPNNFAVEEVAGQPPVLFTIMAVLQNARDNYGFTCGEYDSVCLDPECFLRFNDGVIQASLLRACEPSELNYSANIEASAFVREIIIGMINKRGCYEALPEFLLNLAIGKLRLTDADMSKIKVELENSNLCETYKKFFHL